MNIGRREIRRAKDSIIEFWGRIDTGWPNFSIRAYSIENRSDAKLIVIRSFNKYRKRIMIYCAFWRKNQLMFGEVHRSMGSSDKIRISSASASRTRKDYVNIEIATGYGKYKWSKILKQKIK